MFAIAIWDGRAGRLVLARDRFGIKPLHYLESADGGLAFASELKALMELPDFLVAKWVGMRVERFALFFPPLIWRRKGKGETEYAIGAVPLGGYVKISGMNPHEELPPEAAHRAYYRQPVWKRIAVISAGPAVNIVLAFAILTGLVLANGEVVDGARVDAVAANRPASGVLEKGDRIVSIDGVTGRAERLSRQIGTHKCAGKPKKGCRAETPAKLLVIRKGERQELTIRPEYDPAVKRTRLGFSLSAIHQDVGPVRASGQSLELMWSFTTRSVSTIARLWDPAQREQVSGVVGISTVGERYVSDYDLTVALYFLAVISLSLGVLNLFPFLPLDGGHIFWAIAEKVRGRAIPFSVMERAGFVGFALVMMLFFIGLSNDIGRLTGDGFELSQ
jgi:regulator of sigma E protease